MSNTDPASQAAIAAAQCEMNATELSYTYPTEWEKIVKLREKAKELRIKAAALGYVFPIV